MSKSLRQFECRDDLWARVEALADRRGMSTDDVVQAALVQLFSRKNRPTGEAQPAAPPPPSPPRRATREPAASSSRNGSGGSPRTQAPSRKTGSSPAASSASTRALYLYFEGQCYEVDRDQFVIGRGSKYSDLAIKDANISRRHCAIVRRNGQYFIKDLESTNGVEFNGQRVDNHLIQEGTTYKLCDHEIRFSFVPPT